MCAHVISSMATLRMRSADDLSSGSICEMTSIAENIGAVFTLVWEPTNSFKQKKSVCRGSKSCVLQNYLSMSQLSVKTDGNEDEPRMIPCSVASSVAMSLIPGHTFDSRWNILLKFCQMTNNSHFDAFNSRPILFAWSVSVEKSRRHIVQISLLERGLRFLKENLDAQQETDGSPCLNLSSEHKKWSP